MADSRRHSAQEILPLDAVTYRGFLDLPTLIIVLLFDLQVDKASEEIKKAISLQNLFP